MKGKDQAEADCFQMETKPSHGKFPSVSIFILVVIPSIVSSRLS